jgi:hypothetical protein
MEPTNQSLRARRAYEQALPTILAVPLDSLLPITVDITSMVTKAVGSMPEIRRFRDQVARLPEFDVDAFDHIETYARAAGFAHTRYLAASEPDSALAAKFDEAMKLRELLLTDATALAKRGLLNGKRLSELKGPVGYKNGAQDLATLSEIIRPNLAAIAGKTAVTEADLDRAEDMSDEIITIVGEKEQGPASVAVTSEVRQQAYTLFVRTWEQAHRAISFIRFAEGDADEIVPSLVERRASAKKKEPEPAVSAPAAPLQPANGHAAAPVAAGLPGSDPFNRV